MRMNFFKNRFLFIILISGVTLVGLVVGAFALYKDTSSSFDGEGYIIETTTKTNKKYYFSANTKYKDSVDNKVSFSDKDKNKVLVNPDSFVHYMNGDVSFLKKGAIVNLSELSNPMVTYYNITDDNKVIYEDGGYTVSSNGKKITLDSFIGRISDNKYIIAGKNLSLKIPKVEERIDGEYFEVLYIEEGIVKIDNREASYQVTAQDSYIYVGDNITINLGDGKIFYGGEPKMLMSQITINGDENIDLDVEKDKEGGAGGNGTGTGEGENGNGELTDSQNEDDLTGAGDGTGDGTDGNGLANGDGRGGSDNVTASPQIELVEAVVTSTSIDLSLQLNNASLAQGDMLYYLTNVSTGERVDGNKIELVNGTFKILKESLAPSTEYALTIGELGTENGRQYFQKIFKTSDLGISLEKVYTTDSSLSYRVNFSENTEVTMARVVIYDSDGTNNDISPSEYIVSKNSLNNAIVFEGLKSNSSYSVRVDMVWINNAAYSNIYSINRIDSTLKKTPTLSGVKVDANSEEIKFTIQLDKVSDPDSAIVNYVYKIYDANSITLDNPNPDVIYSVTKNDHDALVLNLNEIAELKSGVDYRAKIFAQYNDNEMIREVSTDYSANFLIRSKPNITLDIKNVSMNKVTAVLNLIDANCSVPINGRRCLNRANNFKLRFYKLRDKENNENDMTINFDPTSLVGYVSGSSSREITFDNLSSNTTYAVKLYGNYVDDNSVVHENVQLGDILYFTTDKSENLQFIVKNDNKSGTTYTVDGRYVGDDIVTFDAYLAAPKDQLEEIRSIVSSIKLNLYSGRYNTKDKLIGSYTIDDTNQIYNFFDNYTIRNSSFVDTTKNYLGNINTLLKLVRLTNNSTGTLNSDYTVEIEGVYYSGDTAKFVVEDNVYTFHLTNSYYLDSRIDLDRTLSHESNKKYIHVTPIKKEELSDSEYRELAKTVTNLDILNDDTIVGVMLENTLSDLFVDSAYTYEKVTLQYTIKNNATGKSVTSEQNKSLEIDMGNKYQPKEIVVYLDPSDLDDGEHFNRGYNYDISYALHFITEDGSNPVYTHGSSCDDSALCKNINIERQDPIFTKYISESDEDTITYKYTFKDLDSALFDKNFYYLLGSSKNYLSVKDAIIADGEEHSVTFPIGDRVHYQIKFATKNMTKVDVFVPVDFADFDFEKKYVYDNSVSYSIIKDNDNVLKLKLENNDFTSRALVYRVDIEDKAGQVDTYTRYFLASRLNTMNVDSGEVDEEGNTIYDKYSYIAIDYANISRFLKRNIKVSVTSYFDNGLVGIDQDLSGGFILKSDKLKDSKGKDIEKLYLNIYDSAPIYKGAKEAMGIYYLNEPFTMGDKNISIYNHLRGTGQYDSFKGAVENKGKDGVVLEVGATNQGLSFVYKTGGSVGDTSNGYSPKLLSESKLVTNNDTTRFNEIIPTVVVDAKPTINSIKLNMTAKGIYGNSQFVKDGQAHRKIYVTFYSDAEMKNRLDTLTSDITISGNDENGYSATISSIEYQNLTSDTTYYYTISAYIDGVYKQLYDSVDNNQYVSKLYSSKTYGKDLLSRIEMTVKPVAYQGESSKKNLTWNMTLKDTSNYKLRMELYAPDGDNYKAVNFDGTNAVSCNKDSNGTSANGFVTNCYIIVNKNDVASINTKDQVYSFSGNDFVFGNGYYKIVIYAIPYTNGSYHEDNKVVLFEKDAIGGSGNNTEPAQSYKFAFDSLVGAKFSLTQKIDSDMENNSYIHFTTNVDDRTSYVMKYGRYYVTLLNDVKEVVESCRISMNGEEYVEYSPCVVSSDYVNPDIKIKSIEAGKRYYVDYSYDTYMNNVGYTEQQKVQAPTTQIMVYSSLPSDVVVGGIKASLVNQKSVSLSFSNSYGLSNIKAVKYTISLVGTAGNTANGCYSLIDLEKDGLTFVTNTTEIFTVSSGNISNFVIDVSDDSTSDYSEFTFKNGNTYSITLEYYNINGELIGKSSVDL